jgi:spore coat protein B
MDFGFLSESIGKLVRLERGGPDKLEGTLRSIMPDYLAVETKKEGVVYVQANHIKTISEHVVTEVQMSAPEVTDSNAPVLIEPQLPLVEAENFIDLLNKLKNRLVRINHGGPNSLQGVLIDNHPDAITILHDMKDYVHYPIFHIKSIMWIYQTIRDTQQGQGNNKPSGGGNGGK